MRPGISADGWSDKGTLTIIPRHDPVTIEDQVLKRTDDRSWLSVHHTVGDFDEVIAIRLATHPPRSRSWSRALPKIFQSWLIFTRRF
jgi:hypothetical protein